MKRALTRLIFADCLFVLFLSVSSLLGGYFEWPLYAAAFVVPTLLLLSLPREEDFKMSVFSRSSFSAVSISLVFPIIFAIFGISFLTSVLMGALGVESGAQDVSGNIFYVIAVSAFAPAVFEEMLFRYLSARLLGTYSKKLTVVYSSILFALAHGNLFQIPYALIAGAMFMAVDLVCTSIMPSLMIHFLNNVLSIVWQREEKDSTFVIAFVTVLLALTLISVVAIYTKRKQFKNAFLPFFEDRSKFEFTYQLGFYIIVMLFLAMSVYVM